MTKPKIKLSIFLVIISVFGIIVIDYLGTRLIVQVNGGIYSLKNRKSLNSVVKPADLGLDSENISIKTEDSLEMKCLIVKSNTKVQKGTIILVHGIRGCKEHFYQLSKQLADSSYNSVLVDLRAHGESTGKYCTYGFKEKDDISRLVDTLIQRDDIDNNIGIWGQSLGAAIALQSMGICPNIKFGIIESTFSDFKLIVHDYFKHYLGFDIPILSDHLIKQAESLTKFNPEDVKPFEYCKHITQPIIIAHGDKDDRIKIEYGVFNYENVRSIDKEFILVKNANHVNVWQIGGKPYMNKLFKFIDRQSVQIKRISAF